MHEMRKTGGYMTVEVSAVLPVVFMVLWMFFSYLFYFMNCGIAQGIIEEATQKAADVRITGADYDTGKISYAKLNQKEIRQQFQRHLFMAGVSSVKVSTSPLHVTTKVKTRSRVISGRFLSMFGIHLFEYEGNTQSLGDFEMEQIRGWNAIEGTMD